MTHSAPPTSSGFLPGCPTNNQNSFSADTLVSTEHGLVPISEIEVGDLVWAWNEETGETGLYTVTDTMVHIDPVIVHLTIGDETIETTPEHPFYTLERGWVDAADLHFGDRIIQLDGEIDAVLSITLEQRSQPMYNLTVDVAHTFFVGEEQWLVHNAELCANSTIGQQYLDAYKQNPVCYACTSAALNLPLALSDIALWDTFVKNGFKEINEYKNYSPKVGDVLMFWRKRDELIKDLPDRIIDHVAVVDHVGPPVLYASCCTGTDLSNVHTGVFTLEAIQDQMGSRSKYEISYFIR